MYMTPRLDKLKEIHANILSLHKSVKALNTENKELLVLISLKERAIHKLIEEKSIGFPWLANAIAEYCRFIDYEVADYLENKTHPAYFAAETVRSYADENKKLKKQVKIAKNFVEYYETLFPWLTDYIDIGLDDILVSITKPEDDLDEDKDPVTKYITQSEYATLTSEQRNQKALDRYLSSRKKPHEIGRDYERYVGYLFEKKGYTVEYTGIEYGLEDLGRDLICRKADEIHIVQCKCWASHKLIHEKHINQLFGTAVKYVIDHDYSPKKEPQLSIFTDILKTGRIKATLFTSTKLSDTALKFAIALGIGIKQELPLEKYPIIKCNIGQNNQKIYHLPFDQQYDSTRIYRKGECYVSTVSEAEGLGFRRAFKWRGDK